MSVRNAVIKGIARLTRPDMLRAVHEMKAYENASDREIQNMQLLKFSALFQHHLKNRFYRKICSQEAKNINHVSLKDMPKLPIVTKNFLRDYFDKEGANEHALRLNSTSGSSGSNLHFYQCRKMLDAASAAVWCGTNLAGVNSWGDRQIGIWGNSPPSNFKMRMEIHAKRLLANDKILQGFGLNKEKSLLYLNIIKKKKPKLVYGYPSYLHFLASTGIEHEAPPPTVGAIICSGEQLQMHQRETIEEYFGQKLYNRYGSREFSGIAHETVEHNGMYVPPMRFILETDLNGELLVTDLDNFATPFIRYAIGDAVTLGNARDHLGMGGQCINEIHGRTHDIISTPSGKLITGQFLTLLTKKVPGILEFQYEQTDGKHLVMLAVTTDKYDPKSEHVLTDYFNKYFGEEMSLSIRQTECIKRTKMGKRRFIIRRRNHNDNT